MSKSKRRKRLFETGNQPLLTGPKFALRMTRFFLAASLLVGLSLLGGMLGYWYFAEMSWIDAFVNSAMILSGMGPVGELKSNSAKFFAGFFALYSGLLLILTSGLLVAPLIHRVLHSFHCDVDEAK